MHTGDCVIDANQAGNNAYAPALQVQQTITVGPTSQTVSFTTTAPASATLGGPTYTPAATASSTLPVTISLDADQHRVCPQLGRGQLHGGLGLA